LHFGENFPRPVARTIVYANQFHFLRDWHCSFHNQLKRVAVRSWPPDFFELRIRGMQVIILQLWR
jgi:hypothetical protein